MADILIIDDDEMMVEIISALLRDEGHQIRAEADGIRGLRAAESRPPDLVVLDMNMPVMDGYAVATSLRRGVGPPRALRIVAVTGESTPGAADAIRAVGCDAIVSKPLDATELLERVAELLR
jgi:CheY-like chemotaxis protein